ncbi:MAG: molybdopterin-dependent oxidoreductase [bacterium]|nr:molybdopterin-dependent oxidoreductase [bacterium]
MGGTGAALAGSAGLAGGTRDSARAAERAAIPERAHELGTPLTPYGSPSPHEKGVMRVPTELTPTKLSSWDFTPLQDLQGIITPNGLFFERNHSGVPSIDPREHRLMIHGMVDGPRIFTMNDLKRYPSVSVVHFLECSGNGLTEWKQPTEKTVQLTHGLVSCAE